MTQQKAADFLEPRLANLHPPEEISGIPAAVERLQAALEKKEQIVLYGDYDVDGISSLALLCRVLRALGGRVDCFIPERAGEGYGLSMAGVERCLKTFQPTLMVAVDCGTNSLKEAQLIRERGADLIVVDHHELASTTNWGQATNLDKKTTLKSDTTIKQAVKICSLTPILVNPQLADCHVAPQSSLKQTIQSNCTTPEEPSHFVQSPLPLEGGSERLHYHYLCSVGLVFKLCHALLKTFPAQPLDLRNYLDLVALGTVADIVPLIDENRILVRHGLKQLATSQWPGVQALVRVSDIKPPYTSIDIGYRLGPRINAAGRLASAEEALALLLTDDPLEAAALAHGLDVRNCERQEVERSVTLEAEVLAAAAFAITPRKSFVLGRPHWHPGVVGIVASRISKRWHRPTLIIGFDEEGRGKGSGRSIEGFSLVTALEQCSHLLEAFGGHAMAAGVTLQELHLEKLQETFEKVAHASLREEDLLPPLKIDAEVDLREINETWLTAQERLGPFGTANPQPLYVARSVRPAKEPRVLKEKHLRLEFASSRGGFLAAIFFNGAIDPLPEPPWDVAFTLERNTYQGRTTVQMQVVALRKAIAS